MTKNELISEICYDTSIEPDVVKAVLDSTRIVIMRALKDGEDVKLFSGVDFIAKLVPGSEYIDPRNGKKGYCDEHYQYKVRMTRPFKEAIQKVDEL